MMQTDKEVVLHYIDKVHDTLKGIAQTTNGIGVLLTVSSLIVLALSIGLVSTDKAVTFGGLNFVVSFWIIIVGGAWVVGILFVYFWHLQFQTQELTDEIIELYEKIGFKPESIVDKKFSLNSFITPNIVSFLGDSSMFRKKSIFDQFILNIYRLIIMIIIIILPLIVESVSYYKIIVLLGWTWWIIVSFLILFFITISTLIILIKNRLF